MSYAGEPSLRDRDPAVWSALRDIGVPRRVGCGTVLLAEGDDSDYLALVEDGAFKVVSVAENGCVAVLGVRCSGDIVGEFAALENHPRSASVVAVRSSLVVVVSGTVLRATLRVCPQIELALLRGAMTRIHEGDRRRVEYSAYEVNERVRRVLVELCWQFGSEFTTPPEPVVIPLVQQDMASLAGVSREAVAKVLRRLRADGVLATGRSRIVVYRPELLNG